MSVASELGIVSIGVTLLMIGGHFDLSVGAVLGLDLLCRVLLMRDYGVPPILAAPLAVAVGAVLGADQWRARREIPHPLLRRDARHDADMAWRGDRVDRRIPDDSAIPSGFKDIMSGPLLDGFRMSMLWFFVIGALERSC